MKARYTKKHATQDPNSCWNRAKDDEAVFVLLGRDLAAAPAVRQWIEERIAFGLNEKGHTKLEDAREWAEEVEESLVQAENERQTKSE